MSALGHLFVSTQHSPLESVLLCYEVGLSFVSVLGHSFVSTQQKPLESVLLCYEVGQSFVGAYCEGRSIICEHSALAAGECSTLL